MRCPFCHDLENRVVDSRLGKEGDAIRRRRHCEHCGRRFTTYERIEESLPMVVKKDGRREPFERAKIVAGLKRACEQRPISVDTIEALVDRIERQLQEGGEREVTSGALGESAMRELHALAGPREPCAGTGRRPPCRDGRLPRRLGRVVVAMPEPNPRVRGRGLGRLGGAGIALTVGSGAEEGRLLTAGYATRVLRGRPLVT